MQCQQNLQATSDHVMKLINFINILILLLTQAI